jgi:lipopolysaccharide transport system ATP-binding protein
LTDTIITIKNLSKRFRVYDRPIDRLKEWITPLGMSYHWAFWALRDVNLEIERGSACGIIGANGAGKSTLLKILCGTLSPTTGSVEINGRITGLLELGSGFHPEFTGRQNIYLNARLMGLSDREIRERMPRILEFAELGDFIDHPLRIYSTGMALRLGFSVAANVDPDILIIDEALAVGDAYFQQKCLRHLRAFRENGGTLLFVSHDPGAVKLLCDTAVLLHEGKVVAESNPEDVLNYYNQLVARHASDKAAFIIEQKYKAQQEAVPQHSGTFDAILTGVEIVSGSEPTRTVISGREATIHVSIASLSDINSPTIGISLRDRLGYEVYGTNTHLLGETIPALKAGDSLTVSFTVPFNIGPGDYTLTAAIHSGVDHLEECYDWADKFLAFKVIPSSDQDSQGIVRLPVTVKHEVSETGFSDPAALLSSLFSDAPESITPADETISWMFSGWHAVEQHDNKTVRWTQRTATFVLRTGAKGILHVEMNTDPILCRQEPLEVTLLANGEPVETMSVEKARWQTLSFHLPDKHINSIIRFSLNCSKVFVPSRISDSADNRELGMIVHKLWSE